MKSHTENKEKEEEDRSTHSGEEEEEEKEEGKRESARSCSEGLAKLIQLHNATSGPSISGH